MEQPRLVSDYPVICMVSAFSVFIFLKLIIFTDSFFFYFFFSFKMMNFLLTYDFLLVFFSGFFQEDHYDRPPATRIHLQSEFDANTEHVYDEIPLQSSPLSSRRNV